MTEDHERLVAEEVEEDPEDDQDGQDEERGRVVDKAQEKDDEDSDGVVGCEVDEVHLESRDRVERNREGGLRTRDRTLVSMGGAARGDA